MKASCSMFSQILKLIPRADFERIVKETGAEYRSKGLSSWSQFVTMLFCQLGLAHSETHVNQEAAHPASAILDRSENKSMSELLKNRGIAIIGESSFARSNIIVVVGVARGGTSMVAGSMAKLGIFMGDKAAPPVFEDMRLSDSFERRDLRAVQDIVQEYSLQHGLWGWKRPSSINYLDAVHRALNAPRYIFIYKDILSIALRNTISMLSDTIAELESANQQYYKTVEFLRKQSIHAMLVSYDKALADPTNFLKELTHFCGIDPDEDKMRQARAFITSNPEQYLDVSRITKSQGHLDGIASGRVYGWARLVNSDEPASVDIFIDDEKVGTVVADKTRPDLMERFNQACAFYFDLPEGMTLRPGVKLRARVVHDVHDLNNSPLLYTG